MFIPVDRKIDWRHPPVFTLLLIAINVLVFSVFQHNDGRALEQALDYYFGSQLPELELVRFAETQAETVPVSEAARTALLWRMSDDAAFMTRLRAGQVVTPEEPAYALWQFERPRYEELLERWTVHRHGLKPADFSVSDLFAHMFLHGGAGHLIGNMIFLFIFGFVVEAAIGRTVFLGAYLLAGLASAGLDIAFRPDSLIPGVGASGAIAGLTGMYTVLFGLRRIRFFYSVLFYFDYVRAPAIILLPIWLAWEIGHELLEPSSVNRIAHIGGLLGGALLGFAARRFSPTVDHGYIDAEERRAQRQREYTQGLDQLATMELDQARATFERLHEEDPGDRNVLLQLYNIAKFDPQSADYHRLAHRILSLPGDDAATVSLVHDIYQEYVATARPSYRFTSEQFLALAKRFARAGHLEAAERIVAGLLVGKGEFPRTAEALLALALGFRRAGEQDKYLRCRELLWQRYPGSAASRQLRQMESGITAPGQG